VNSSSVQAAHRPIKSSDSKYQNPKKICSRGKWLVHALLLFCVVGGETRGKGSKHPARTF
jgi:hypothetical protein